MEPMEHPGQYRQYSGKPHERQVRPHPLAAAIALVLLFAALPVGCFFGYLSWTRTIQLEATEDGHAASHSLAISEVSGRMSSAPVTDDQHVAAGGIIGRVAD